MDFKTSKTSCCVVGCSYNYINAPIGTAFYSFPSEKKYPGRKEKWLAAIKRKSADGKPWKPSSYSKVCSVHFVGGKKSEHPHHPAFVPTLMPTVYKKRPRNVGQQTSRFHRLQKRCVYPLETPPEQREFQEIEHSDEQVEARECTSVAIQTDPVSRETINDVPVLFCCLDGRNSGTQCNIPPRFFKNPSVVKLSSKADKKCGPDLDDCPQNMGFMGYKSIKCEDELRGLCGVTFAVFHFLSTNLTKKFSSKLTSANRLLLFLIKMKIGLTFAALGVLFDVHRTTASRTFLDVLEELVQKCSNLVFWPSRSAIQSTMPSVFSDYPRIRSIIDCTEISTERPPKVENQVFMYSEYKGRYTIKYLISVTPNGLISFVSKGYGGRATDAYITQNSGFLELLEPGDLIMADKGFPLIKHDLDNKYVELVMPPFATCAQFSEKETEQTYEIARVRIHVERCIGRLKMFRILEKIPVEMFSHIDNIVRMCSVLVNMQPPIIKPE